MQVKSLSYFKFATLDTTNNKACNASIGHEEDVRKFR